MTTRRRGDMKVNVPGLHVLKSATNKGFVGCREDNDGELWLFDDAAEAMTWLQSGRGKGGRKRLYRGGLTVGTEMRVVFETPYLDEVESVAEEPMGVTER